MERDDKDEQQFESLLEQDPRRMDDSEKKSSLDKGNEAPGADMMYKLEDKPAWHLSFLLGIQHYLAMLGGTVAVPIILAPGFCTENDRVAQAEMLNNMIFLAGMITLLQTTFGTRLPIVQGATFSLLTPTLAILNLPKWTCPESNATSFDLSMNGNTTHDDVDVEPPWHSRMREIQGAIICASLIQVIVGVTGMLGFLLRFVGPLAITPTITLIGISLFDDIPNLARKNWWIAFGTFALVTIFSQFLKKVRIPICKYSKKEGWKISKYPFFEVFPVILAIGVMWSISAILTAAGVFTDDPNDIGYGARADAKVDAIDQAVWFRVPYPFQYGLPTVSVTGVFAIMSGIIASIVESVGDYHACARLIGSPAPPIHAMNRGCFMEGLGSVLAGIFGTGSGTTSISQNIGVLAVTKVGARRVINASAILMLLFGVLGKFGAVFVSIPDPIIGGTSAVLFGIIVAVGISNLQFVDLNSSRNLFILGASIFMGLSFPWWLAQNPDVINTGDDTVDEIITVLFSTSMFVGTLIGLVLDNAIPGTEKERGLVAWTANLQKEGATIEDKLEMEKAMKSYDFPFSDLIGSRINCTKYTRYIPICPAYKRGRTAENMVHDVSAKDVEQAPAVTHF